MLHFASSSGNLSRLREPLRLVLGAVAIFMVPSLALASIATTTTLSAPSGTVTSGTVITLSAYVHASSGGPYGGQVAFCDASAAHCTDIHRLGTTALLAGYASFKFAPGPGMHSYKAIYLGNTSFAASTSSPTAVSVTPLPATTTSIAPGGSAGSYTETALVQVSGSTAPTGTISILDTSNANYVLGSSTLTPSASSLTFTSLQANSTGTFPTSVATGDFNGDGKPDLAIANYVSNSVTVLLGNGDGTFTLQTTLTGFNQPNSIAVGDFNNDGVVDLAVLNSGTTEVWVMLGTGGGNFGTQHTTSVSINPSFLAVADFNNDGISDLVVTSNGSNNVDVLTGDGTGTFSLSGLHATGNAPTSVAVADFNNDGNQDMVVTNLNDSTVTVLFGNGQGNISSAVTIGVFGGSYSVVAADLNGDGNLDFIVANYLNSEIEIFLGSGTGTFTHSTAATGSNPIALAVGDFNGDGIPDLAAVNANSSGSTSVLLGKGNGTFQAALNVPAGNDPRSVAVADFNGDGVGDLAVPNYVGANATILLAQPTQSSSANVAVQTPVGTGTHQVIGSYPGDANVAASISASSGLMAFRVSGQTFTLSASPASSSPGQLVTLTAILSPYVAQGHSTDGEHVTFNTYPGGNSIGTASLQSGVATLALSTLPAGTSTLQATYPGDGNFYNQVTNDLSYTVAAVTSTTLRTGYTSAPAGTSITLTATVLSGSAPVSSGLVAFCDASAAHCTDVHRLGTAQLSSAGSATLIVIPAIGSHSYKAVFLGTVAAEPSSSGASALAITGSVPTLTTLTSSGSPGSYALTATLVSPTRLPLSGTVSFVDTSNGNAALGSATISSSSTTVALGNAQTIAAGTQPKAVATGDFNGDGKPDFIVGNYGGSSLTVELGNGDGSFTASAVVSANLANPEAIVVGDFNADGKQDLAVANYGSSTVSIFLGNGDGTFRNVSSNFVPSLQALSVGDFNNDGIADLAATSSYGNTVSVLLGNGDGTFTPASGPILVAGNYPSAVVVADFNHDGVQDIAVANVTDRTITVFFGSGAGQFPSSRTLAHTGASYSLATADLDGDGNADLIALDSGGNTVTVLRGDGTGAFTALASTVTATNPLAVAVGDLNGDGIPDLVTVAGSATAAVNVFFGNGDGTFQAATAYSTGLLPQALALADFNGDGFIDAVTANYGGNNASVFLAQPQQTALVSVNGISPVGPGTSHAAQAMYAGDTAHAASTSNLVSLTALPYASAPTFAPAAGTYPSPQTVTLATSTAGATVFYTTDGSTPTPSSPAYSAPIAAAASETIKAIASAPNFQTSAVASAAYIISPPPTLTNQPASQTINSGASATLAVSAAGAVPLIYQWFNGISPNTASPIAGATSSTYTTPHLTANASFWVQVTNASGFSANSASATITVITPPTITGQPASQTINSGGSATLSVAAGGTSPSLQWYAGISGNTVSPVAGATSSSYTTPSLTVTSSFWVRASNQAGFADSATSIITVIQVPVCTLSVQPTATALAVVATARCSDPQNQSLTATLDWGDGTAPVVTAANATSAHTYAKAGVYAVTVTAKNSSGLTGSATVRVSPNQSPVCTLGVVQGQISTVLTQYPVTVSGGCTDPQGQPLALSLDWGDGSVVAPQPLSGPPPYTHTYSGSGTITYNVVLTASDNFGLTGSSAPQPVQIVPALPIPAGGSADVSSSIMPPPLATPPSTQVMFVCSSVSVQVNGQTVTTLPSTYGITCASSAVLLTSAPIPVNVSIFTSNGAASLLRPPQAGSGIVLCGIAFPFVGWVLLLPVSAARRRRLTGLALACTVCLSLSACGGSFRAPVAAATPTGLYYITLVETVVNAPAPTGFVQTSLIVPLPVTH